MSQTQADMQGDAAIRAAVRGPDARPLSPHVSVWRWHVTMAGSILTRVSGVGLYLGALIVAAWALALAGGPELYGAYMGVMASWPGRAVLVLLTLGVWYHTAAGIRHLVWDMGYGYHPRTASQVGWGIIAFTVLATVLTWVAAAYTGAL